MSDEIDPLEIATQELADAMCPTPDDLLGDIGPLGTLWYLHEVAAYTLQKCAGMVTSPDAGTLEDDSEPVRALAAITTAMGVINGACEILSLIPDTPTAA
jgi:hypothetical protein